MAIKPVEVPIKIDTGASIAELKALKKELKGLSTSDVNFARVSNEIDDMEDKLKSAKNVSKDWIDSLESAPGPIGMLGRGLNTLKVSTQSFGAALKATGIGLIVSLLGGMVAAISQNEAAMKKLQPIMDAFQKILGGIFKAIEPLLDVFIDLAMDVLPVLTNVIGGVYAAFSGLFTFIKTYALGVGKIMKGIFTLDFDSITEGVDSFKNILSDSWESTKDTYGKFQEGTKEQTALEKEEAEKRKKDAEEAAKKQAEIRAKELASRKADLDAKITLETNSENTSKENLKKLLDERYKAELEGSKLSESQKLALKAEYAKKLDDALAADEAARQKKIAANLDAEIQLETDKQNTSRETLLALLNQKMDAELANIDLSEAQKEAIRAKYAKQLTDAIQADEDARLAIKKKASDDAITLINDTALVETTQTDAKYGELKRFDEEYYTEQKANLDKQAQALKASLDKGTIDQVTYTKNIAGNTKARVELDKLEKTSGIEKTKMVGDALGQLSTIVGQDTVAGKGFAVAKATIDTYQAATAAYASLAGIPVVGPILGGIAAAAAIATGIATVQKIVQVQVPNAPSGGSPPSAPIAGGVTPGSPPPVSIAGTGSVINATKKAEGGYISGPGTGTSDSIPALLSNGEYVINARSTRLFQPLLSAINETGSQPQFSVGGLVQSQKKNDDTNNQKLIDLISASISSQPVRTFVTSTDITNQQQFDRTIKSRSLI
jgi:hypothetical protein